MGREAGSFREATIDTHTVARILDMHTEYAIVFVDGKGTLEEKREKVGGWAKRDDEYSAHDSGVVI